MKGESVLKGIKVVDFSWVVMGPTCTKCLADYGAEVIRVESSAAFDSVRGYTPYRDNIPGINRSCQFASFNTSKRSVTLNLRKPQAVEIIKKLVSQADVVVENFRPGTMERLGLSYKDLKQVNSKIIMLSLSGSGQNGPYCLMPAFGMHLNAWAGFSTLLRLPNREPIIGFLPYPDYVGAYLGVIAIVGSLLYRQRTGEGQHIDLSMLEASILFLAPVLLDYVVNGREAVPVGNRSPYAAPHGVYRCSGNDRWVAISVFNDEEWAGLIRAIGSPDWASDAKFVTILGRKQNEDELDKNIEEWTRNRTAEEVVRILQANGVVAAVVQDGHDLVEDPQLSHRQHFQIVREHRELGTHYAEVPVSFLLSKGSLQLNAAPCLGQSNEYVFTKMLGMSDEEFVELVEQGVIG